MTEQELVKILAQEKEEREKVIEEILRNQLEKRHKACRLCQREKRNNYKTCKLTLILVSFK